MSGAALSTSNQAIAVVAQQAVTVPATAANPALLDPNSPQFVFKDHLQLTETQLNSHQFVENLERLLTLKILVQMTEEHLPTV